MFTLRATRKLLTAMKAKPLGTEPPAPTTVLGDWYAKLTYEGYVVCVSEKTLLPVVLPRESLGNVETALPQALALVLDGLNVERAAIERERFAMAQSAVATTASRRIVGFLNEFEYALVATGPHEGSQALLEASLQMAHTPCRASSPKGWVWPDEATRAAFMARRSP